MPDLKRDEGPEASGSPAPYLRLPVPLVASALMVFLVGLLAFGVYANQNLRPRAAAPGPTVVATVAPVIATATPQPIAALAATAVVASPPRFPSPTLAPT